MTYTKLLVGSFCGGLLGAGVWACAGEKIPFHSETDDRAIAAAYAGSANLPPGNGGSSGDGGSAGSSSSQGGSGVNPGNGGSNSNAGSGNLPGGSGGSGNANVCNAPEDIFFVTCGGDASFCHGDGSGNGDFAASAANARALLDEPSASGERCGLFIDSGNIDESLILTKVTDEFDRDACQGQGVMPLLADPLAQDEIDCIESWLSQFAD